MHDPGLQTAPRTPATDEPTAPDPTHDLAATTGLADYLSNRDAPCPGCGYNLRGSATTKCPECGTPLELELRRRRPLAGWGAFLLLAFAWLFIAGSLNTARNVRVLIQTHQQTAMAQTRMAAARAQLQAQLQRFQQQAAAAGSIAGPSDDSPASAAMKLMRQRAQLEVQAMQSAMQQSLQAQLQAQLATTFPATQPVPTLAQVWIGQGWKAVVGSVCFATLGLCGALGLLLLLISRLQRWPEGSIRALAAAAGLLFTLYAAWHITLFASEFR